MRRAREIPGFRNSRAVAAENGVTVKTLLSRVRSGLFPPPIRDGGQWFWSVTALARFYQARAERAERWTNGNPV